MTATPKAAQTATTGHGASAEAIQHHYDLSTDFFRLWLDGGMTYSCARWTGCQFLEAAQREKLVLLADWAGVRDTARVLDIGCGWGSMLRYLVDDMGVGKAVGLTLSREQFTHVLEMGDPRIVPLLESWEHHSSAAPYDAIICVGALEHFVQFGRPRSEKVDAYRAFFDRCHELLQPGGAMALQTIAKGNVPLDDQGLEDLLFIAGKIFPQSDVPRLAELCHAMEKRFEVVTVLNERLDYARTCTAWLERLEDSRANAVELVGEETVALYERYLRCSIRQFEQGQTTLLRLQLRRV